MKRNLLDSIKIKNNNIAYIATQLLIGSFPNKDTNQKKWEKINGRYTLTIETEYKLPYGPKARLIMIHFCSRIINNNCCEFSLSKNEHSLIKELGLLYKQSSVKCIREQMERFSKCKIIIKHKKDTIVLNNIFYKISIDQNTLFLLRKRMMPFDNNVLTIIKDSSLDIDIYLWLTNRVFSSGSQSIISWENLSNQFGATYKYLKDFKIKTIKSIKRIMAFTNYCVEFLKEGVIIKQSNHY